MPGSLALPSFRSGGCGWAGVFILALFGFGPAQTQSLPPPPGWAHSAPLVIGTVPGWAPLPDSVRLFDFPLLVRLDSAYFDFGQAAWDGRDLRFYKNNGTPLESEIEQWDPKAGVAAVWVGMDTLTGNSFQRIHMQWGNPAAPGHKGGSGVFDTAAGFSGVWHMGEIADTLAREATVNGFTGIRKSAREPAPIEGMVGTGQLFDGVDDAIDLGQPAGRDFVNGVESATLSAWVRIDAFASHNQGLLQLSTWSGGTVNSDSRANLEISGSTKGFRIYGRAPDDAPPNYLTSTQLPTTGIWYHFAGVIDYARDAMRLYINGELDTSAHTPFDSASTDSTNTRSAAIGAGDNATYDYFKGTIDEVRVSRTIRSAEWIRLSYRNQGPVPALVSFPVEEGCLPRFGTSDTVVNISEGQAATLSGMAKCALLAHWSELSGNPPAPRPVAGLNLDLSGVRVRGDTTLPYRFSALYVTKAPPDTSWQSVDITVHVAEAIPDPVGEPPSRSLPDLFFSVTGRGMVHSLKNREYRTVEILNLRGVVVRDLPVARHVHWDGGDGSGGPAASGIYIVRFRSDDVSRQFKFVYK